MAGNEAGGGERVTVRQEIPVDEIKEAMKNYPEVIVMIRRRNLRGSWASVGPSVRKSTEDLLEIADFCREVAGGGKFKVDALDPMDKTRHVVPPFEFENEGQERPSKLTASGAPGFSPGANPQRPPQWGPQMPGPVYIDRGGGDADAAGIAQEHARDYRQDFIAEKHAREADREKFEHSLAEVNARIAETERKAQDEIRRERERQAEERFRAMELRMSTPPKSSMDAATIAAFAGPAAAVITAIIEAGKTRSQLQAEGLERSVTTQLALVKDLVTGKKDDGGTERLMAIMMPLVKASMEEKSPSKIAELVTAQADASMQTLSIVAQFLEKMSPADSDNPWVDMARQAVGSITKAAEQMTQYSRQAVGGQRLGAGNGAQPQQQLAPEYASPKQIADAVYKAPGLPKGLKTSAWYEVFFELHVQVDPAEVAKKMAQLLEAADPTPPPFTGLFQDENNPPSHYLAPFLQQLPVWQQNPQYAQAVLHAFDNAFGTEDDEDEDDDDADTASTQQTPQPVVRPTAVQQQPFAEPAVIDTTASESS